MHGNPTPSGAPVRPPPAGRRARLLVVELWGLGDLALAVPFLREASRHAAVTLVAKPEWGPLVLRFCPEVELVPFNAPWTAFRGKYRLHAWPWGELRALVKLLRARDFELGVSARSDPRDHFLLALAGVRRRHGYRHHQPAAALASRIMLTSALPRAGRLHRRELWAGLAQMLGWALPPPNPMAHDVGSRRVVMHVGAGQPTRVWPRERFDAIAAWLRNGSWQVTILDDSCRDLDQLINTLSVADRFIGNDSGPGHVAALLGVPTFTIFGPQLPEVFAPPHPKAAWIEGHPCPCKPCRDYCRYDQPHCIRGISVDEIWPRLETWLKDG